MSQKNKKILILTSRQNNVWLSMQEIIPALEKVWSLAAEKEGLNVVTLTAEDEKEFKKIRKEIFDIDLIFVTAFNVPIAQKLVLLRQHMFIDAPWVFQLHNQATIGLWPLFQWGMGSLLTTRDQFISTSCRDAKCFDDLFENATAKTIPFPALHRPSFQKKKEGRFCYIGRLSEQKNIHTLIWAYHLYRKRGGRYQLDLFGGEDDLSSPNMGIKTRGYLYRLKKMCKDLGIENDVNFLGLVSRDELHNYWSSCDSVMVSASLHSDENFGLALMQGLTYGHVAVVTDWGGHTDFLETFPEQVSLLRVYESRTGPFLDVDEFSYALSLAERKPSVLPSIPEYYTSESVSNQAQEVLKKIVEGTVTRPEKLKPTQLLKETLSRIEFYESQKNGRIFESYQDTLAHKFFKLYGMENKRSPTQKIGSAPWCEVNGKEVIVKDPHRGERILSVEQASTYGYIQ